MSTSTSTSPTPTPVPRVLGVSVLLALILGVVTVAFALPNVNLAPNEVPIAVVGPDEAAAQVQAQLDSQEPDGFDVTPVADAEAATELIEDREVYGALALGPDGVTVMTASAASPLIARMLTGIADGISASQGLDVQVDDVVSPPEDDPNGVGLAASALPLALGGIIIAALLMNTVNGAGRRALGGIAAPILVAAGLAALMRYGLGIVDGNYWYVTGALALTLLGATWAIMGLNTLLGTVGFGLGAATIMLLGNPLSGLASAPEMLPAGWGAFGQYLPPGAGGTLLRNAAFFDGAAVAMPAMVLSAWLVGGVMLFAIGSARRRLEDSVPQDELAESTAA